TYVRDPERYQQLQDFVTQAAQDRAQCLRDLQRLQFDRQQREAQVNKASMAQRQKWTSSEDEKLNRWVATEHPGLRRGSTEWNEVQTETGKIMSEMGLWDDWNAYGRTRSFATRKGVVELALSRVGKRQATAIRAKIDRENVRPVQSAMRPGNLNP